MFAKFRKSVENSFKNNNGDRKISTKSVTAFLMFGAIVVVFALFGLPGRDGSMGSGGGAAATVNSSRISVADLRSEAQQLEQMYAPMFGGNFGGEAQRQYIQSMALENLISKEIVQQVATKEGIYATDAEIRDYITKDIPAFQKEGRFKKDVYVQLLEANRMTPGEFEDKVRKDRVNQRSRHLMEIVTLPLALEFIKSKELKENKINIAFAKVDKEILENTMTVSPANIKTELEKPDFSKKVEEYFKSHKAEFSAEAEVKAQHILIKTDAAIPESEAQALQKIKDLQKRSQSEDFGKLAKEFSEDTGSKVKSGDLGWFGKGRMVPEFEGVAFSQKIGTVSEPVKSSFGYHLIKVTDKKEAKNSEFAEVKEKIAKKILASEKYDSEMKKLEELLAKKDLPGVDMLLKELGANWDQTGFFEYGAESIPKITSQEAAESAFGLTTAQPLLGKIVRDGGQKFVLKLLGTKKEEVTAPLPTVSQMAKERSYDLFNRWVEVQKKAAKIERNQQLSSR